MLKVDFCGIRLKNPTRLASGILGVTAQSLIRVARSGAGAVTMKSVGPKEREGHNNPTVIDLECGLLNAVGLPTPGYKNMEEEMEELKELKKLDVPLIGSVYGTTVGEFVEVAQWLCDHRPSAIELDMSCPNAEWGGSVFAHSAEVAKELVEKVKNVSGKIPVIAKLSPNTHLINEVGIACEEAGADALCAINTLSAMSINIEAKRPVLHFKRGGLSGPALKPVAVRCIYDLFEHVSIPIIGEGGCTSGRDAIEFLQAGATVVGVGSAVRYEGIELFGKICDEMKKWIKQNGYTNVKQLVGIAHENG
ncbi:MAG: dihydroorotate dehydrogenase [Candidatus Diapherotrites archaeon]|nr:dihydroorotate dehydrogenase [Candidatus Diapherotrites archaeon]